MDRNPSADAVSRPEDTAGAVEWSERALESDALKIGAITFIATALVALVVFRFAPAPISGPGSIGQFAALASAPVAICAFIVGRIVVQAPGQRMGVGDLVDIAALAVAHAIIALLTWTLLAVILARGFLGAEVFAFSLVVLAGASAAVTAYLAFHSATHMDLQLLAIVLAVFLVEGVLASMLTATDPLWWKHNFSALGMTGDLSSLAFNLTLIVAGVVITTLARYATRGIPTTHAHGIRNVRISLTIVGVSLAVVGLLPDSDFHWVHTGFATGMTIVFGVLVLVLHRWIPGLSRTFIQLGWVFIGLIAVLTVLFVVGVYTLTAVELVAGVLVFAWIILFLRNGAALAQDAGSEPGFQAAG